MRHVEDTLRSLDGTELFAQRWEPDAAPKAIICLVHGLGEHSGRYSGVADTLTAAGYAVSSYDLRGHGRSPGARGDAPFPADLSDIDALLADAAARWPDRPRFLYGHSLGGLLVLTYVLQRDADLAGVVATSAGLRSPVLDQRLKMLAAKVLGAVAPSVTMPTGLDAAGLSRDRKVVDAYLADPLVHDKASLALGRDGAAAAAATLADAARFPLPLLMVHGTADPITYSSGTEAFAAKVTGDCTVHLYDGLFHETHNEPERDKVLAETITWLDVHVPDA